MTRLAVAPWKRRNSGQMILALVLGVLVQLGPGSSHASILSLLESAGRLGGRAGEAVGERAAGEAASTTAIRDMTRHAAVAASVLSAAGAAAYLVRQGDEILLHLAGATAPVRLLSETASDLASVRSALERQIERGRYLILDSNLVAAMRPQSEWLYQQFQLGVYDTGYGVRQVVEAGSPGGRRLLVQLDPGLAIPLQDAAMPASAWALLGTPLKREKVKVIAMVSEADPDTLARLFQAGGDRVAKASDHIIGGHLSLDALRDGVAILVGHVERDAFVLSTTTAGGAAQRIGFAAIEAEAARTGTSVFYVGCETFGEVTGSGYLQKIRDIEVTQALNRALAADTYEQLLAGLGTPKNPFVMVPSALRREADRVMIEVERLNAHHASVDGGLTSVRLAAPQQIAAAAGPGLFVALGSAYLLGGIPALLAFRRSWASFDRLFPTLPNRMTRPCGGTVALTAKWVLFALLLPFSALAVAILILMGGGWSNRDGIFELFWSLFLKPLHFLAAILSVSFMLTLRGAAFVLSGASLLPGAWLMTLDPVPDIIWLQLTMQAVGLALLISAGFLLYFVWRKQPLRLVDPFLNWIIDRFDNRAIRLTIISLPFTAVVTLALVIAAAQP